MEFEWGKELDLFVDATIEWKYEGHDGIGSYDYHGSMCYDAGDPVWEIESIKFRIYNENSEMITPTVEMYGEIMDYIKSNATPDFD